MKKNLITEKKRDFGKKGPMGSSGSNRPVSSQNKDLADAIKRFFNTPGSIESNVPKDEIISRLERQTGNKPPLGAQAAADVADVDPSAAYLRNQASGSAEKARQTKPAVKKPLSNTTTGGPVRTIRLGDPGAPSKEAAKTLQRMTTADPLTTARLQSNLKRADTKPTPPPAAPKPVYQADVSQRARRFRQSFGTPTGANPFTGQATYAPPTALTDLPKGKGGSAPSPEAYARTTVGDLEAKRIVRTSGPQGTPTESGVRNFLLNRETKGALGGRGARTISPEQGQAAMQRVAKAMTDPKTVSDVEAKITREVGGRRAGREPSLTPSGTGPRAATTPRTPTPPASRNLNPPSATRATGGATPSTSRTLTQTATKVKQSLNLGISAPPAPAPAWEPTKPKNVLPAKSSAPPGTPDLLKTQRKAASPPSTAGQNLEFTKSKTGSFTYKPSGATSSTASAAAATVAQPKAPEPSWVKTASLPPASTTRRGVPRSEPIPTPKATPDLGARSTTVRSGQSATIRPSTPKPAAQQAPRTNALKGKDIGKLRNMVKSKRFGTLGLVTSAGFGAWDAMDRINQKSAENLQKGGTGEVSFKDKAREWVTAAGGAVGGSLGATAGASAGSIVPIPGAGIAGGLYGGQKGYEIGSDLSRKAFDASYDTVAGASKSDKEWMKWANRTTQTGTTAKDATYKSGNKAIIRDAQGRERVGYLSYKDGQAVYKHGNDPKSLRYTSSNALERIGRALLPGQYAKSDEAARKQSIAAFKAQASNK